MTDKNTNLTITVGDTALVKAESATYRAAVEIVNGDRITIRPLPDQGQTTRARAVNRAAILSIEATSTETAKPALEIVPATAPEPEPTPEPASAPAPEPEPEPEPEIQPIPASVSDSVLANELADIRHRVGLALNAKLPRASEQWMLGWQAAWNSLLRFMDKQENDRSLKDRAA